MGFWSRIPRFWQNFVAGLLIVGMLVSFGRLTAVKTWEDWAVDLMMRLNSSLARMTGEARGRPDVAFTMLDMDELSFRDPSWREPYHVPRDKLLQLIRFAVEGRASLIIVDVDLSTPGVDPAADGALKDYLQQYPPSAPPLVLMRPLRAALVDQNRALGEFRETYFGDLGQANIHYAAPVYRRDTADSVVRRWVLFEQGCYKGQGLALPSVQLLAEALLKDRRAGGREHIADLGASMLANRPVGCAGDEKRVTVRRPVVIGGEVFENQVDGERLIYTIPWEKTGRRASDLRSVPAVFVTDRGFQDFGEVADRITLIGASYGASHDLHMTPLGLMPGALIILNAVKSLALFDQIKPPPLYVRLPLLLGFVTLLSWVFSRFSNLLKLVVIGVLVVIFFVPISFLFFKYGVWFDFGIMLFAIKLQHSLSEAIEIRQLRRWRARAVAGAVGAAPATIPDDGARQVAAPSSPLAAQTPGSATVTASAGEQRHAVRISRDSNRGFLVATNGEGAVSLHFEVAPDGIEKTNEGYLLRLKTCDKI